MPIISPRISNAAPHGPYVQLSSVSQDAPLLAAAAAVDRAVDRIEASQAPAHYSQNTTSGTPQDHSPGPDRDRGCVALR